MSKEDKEDNKRILCSYRLQQAKESLDEAIFLYEGGKSPRSVINRAYYSMFYAVLALLIYESYSSSKHSGVISYFNKFFVKTGIIGKDHGRALNKASEIRQRGDYREQLTLTRDQIRPYLDHSRNLIEAVETHLLETGKL